MKDYILSRHKRSDFLVSTYMFQPYSIKPARIIHFTNQAIHQLKTFLNLMTLDGFVALTGRGE